MVDNEYSLTGTPDAAPGTYQIDVQVTDGCSAVADQQFYLTIGDDMAISMRSILPLAVPDRIVVAVVAKLSLYGFRPTEWRFPELLRILENAGDAAGPVGTQIIMRAMSLQANGMCWSLDVTITNPTDLTTCPPNRQGHTGSC